MDTPDQAPGALQGIAEVLDAYLQDYSRQVAATRGSQAALQASIDRLEAELTAAHAALPGRAALAASLRLGGLRERVHLLNRRAAEIEHRVEAMRAQLARQAASSASGG